MPDICQELVIAAPVHTVFHALTEQQGLAGWWTPNVTASPLVGSIARFGFGPSYVKHMLVAELDRPSRVRWVCQAGADEWVGTSLTFDLRAGDSEMLAAAHPEARGQLEQAGKFGAGTLLRFTHSDWRAATPMFAECSYTWGRFLRSLKLLCETGQGNPTPTEHGIGRAG